MLQVTADMQAELSAYRRWSAERRVDGVLMVDLRMDDPRVAEVEALPLPAVVLGGPDGAGSLPYLWNDDASTMAEVVHYLAALGHRYAVHVAGPQGFMHTDARTRAFLAAAEEAGLDRAEVINADYTGEEGTRLTRKLLARTDRPTALVYDNDLMAVAGLGVAHEMGVDVPSQLSLVAWDDSVLCRLVRPPLTAVAREIEAAGGMAARMLSAVVEGEPVRGEESPRGELRPRGSTGPVAHP